MEILKKAEYDWSVTLPVLLVLLAGLQTSAAQTCPAECFGCGTTTVRCDNRDLTSFPQLPLDVQQSVQDLNVYDNKFTVLQETALENYRNLHKLQLSVNQLTELPEGLFSATTQLEYLDLGVNQLTKLPEGLFSATTQLQTLYLHINQLTELPEGLFGATTKLQHLALSDNQLTEVPKGLLGATTQLQFLSFTNNHLTELPEGLFSATTQLNFLGLNNNRLTKLPEGLFGTSAAASQLYLTFDNNQLTELPEGLFTSLPHLRTLDLSDNQLTGLPKSLLSTNTEIERLELYGNPLHCDCNLSWLPEFLRNLPKREYENATCATPTNLAGKAIVSLTEDQFICELKFVGLTISAAGDGTYNLSVDTTHGAGKGSYFITLVRINDNTETRQAYGTVFTNLPGGEEYRVVVTQENLGKVVKSIQTQAIIPHTPKNGLLNFERLKISPDKRKDGAYDLYVETTRVSGKGKFVIVLVKPDKTRKPPKKLRNFEMHFPGLSGGEEYGVQVRWRADNKTKASIKTSVVILP